jgi:hypothetical protein
VDVEVREKYVIRKKYRPNVSSFRNQHGGFQVTPAEDDVRSTHSQRASVPVLLGVNMPWSQMLYFQRSMLVAVCVHELGHALCAEGRGVSVERNGISVVAFIPVASALLCSFVR